MCKTNDFWEYVVHFRSLHCIPTSNPTRIPCSFRLPPSWGPFPKIHPKYWAGLELVSSTYTGYIILICINLLSDNRRLGPHLHRALTISLAPISNRTHTHTHSHEHAHEVQQLGCNVPAPWSQTPWNHSTPIYGPSITHFHNMHICMHWAYTQTHTDPYTHYVRRWFCGGRI